MKQSPLFFRRRPFTMAAAMIAYRFLFEDGRSMEFTVDLDRHAHAHAAGPHADWTRLEFHRCERCPLAASAWRHCPAALDLEPYIASFSDVLSYTRARVEVTTPERTYLKECDIQTALRSLLGLVMATGACPTLAQFRGLAASHLPFATLEETLFRTTGAYLLKQYFVHQGGGTPDLELRGLNAFYQELQQINSALKRRLDAACAKDANLNALGALFYVSLGVTYSLAEHLQDLRQVFCPREGLTG